MLEELIMSKMEREGTESKREKFVRLAENRVEVALKKIRIIGNLGNRNNYEYSAADIEKIQNALEGTVKQTIANFRENVEEERFKL